MLHYHVFFTAFFRLERESWSFAKSSSKFSWLDYFLSMVVCGMCFGGNFFFSNSLFILFFVLQFRIVQFVLDFKLEFNTVTRILRKIHAIWDYDFSVTYYYTFFVEQRFI